MRKIDSIYVHATDTPPSMNIGVEEIRRWHVEERGWADIGYHYVIRRSGKIETGRDLDGDGDIDEEVGAHVRGENAHSIGIALVGGAAGEFDFTFLQLSSLVLLVGDICRRYNIPMSKVRGHRDADPSKKCPGFSVSELFHGMTPKEFR